MDIDFHYYATYVAAVLAGHKPEDAYTIAHAGQYIDDNEPSRALSRQKLGFDPVTSMFSTGEELSRNSDWSTMTIAHDRAMWTAFHFLPGNIDQHLKYTGPRKHSGFWGQKWEYDELAEQQFKTLCHPDSPMAIAMVNDTIQHHAEDLHMVGLRMHVLIDTFAHMLYSGSAAWHTNEVEQQPEVWNGKQWVRCEIPPFTYTPAMGLYYNSIIYTGHGRMGHVPDLPWVKYRYQPKWSNKVIEKDNPTYYRRAFIEMVHAMSCIRNRTPYKPVQSLPSGSPGARAMKRVEAIINTWPDQGDAFLWGSLNDFPDARCALWRREIPQLEQDAKISMPLPPEYNADVWLKTAESSSNVAGTDYAKWHRAAGVHLNFVKQKVWEAGLTLLGGAPFVHKEEIAHLVGKNVWVKPGQESSTYLEVEDSSESANSCIQLWDANSPRNELNWALQFAGKGLDGYDRFELYNPTLDRYATFVPRPLPQLPPGLAVGPGIAVPRDQFEGVRIKSEQKDHAGGIQSFPIARHQVKSGGGVLNYYSICVANDVALQPEGGNLGNSTKLIAAHQGGDDLKSLRWEFVQHPQPSKSFALTLDGVLLAGGFRNLDTLVKMEPEGKRNTLIVEMTGHTNQSREHFWRSNNEALVGKAAVALFLMKNGLATRAQLQQQSDDTQRRTLITANQKHTKKSADELGKMSNRQLVLLGFTWASK